MVPFGGQVSGSVKVNNYENRTCRNSLTCGVLAVMACRQIFVLLIMNGVLLQSGTLFMFTNFEIAHMIACAV
jgi:hypothetical protein